MRTWLLPVFLCALLSAQAQRAVIDLLQRRLDKYPAPDTLRADLLKEISWWYIQNDIRKGIATVNKSIEIGKKLNDTNRLAIALSRKAANLNAMGRDSLALHYFDQVLALRKNIVPNTAIWEMAVFFMIQNLSAHDKNIHYYHYSKYCAVKRHSSGDSGIAVRKDSDT